MKPFVGLRFFSTFALASLIFFLPATHGFAVGTPTIATQPSPGIFVQTSNLVAAVTANSNGAALYYRWQCNGAVLTDDGRVTGSASNVLTIANIQLKDTGIYQVIVTNIYGAVTSSPAILLVGSPAITFNTNGAGWTTNQSVPVLYDRIPTRFADPDGQCVLPGPQLFF